MRRKTLNRWLQKKGLSKSQNVPIVTWNIRLVTEARRNKLIQDKSKERAEKIPPQVYQQVTTGKLMRKVLLTQSNQVPHRKQEAP
jgi:hypothetical protein